jgi:predicted RNA-binding Zn-ribbon protein involved in translation (DUF1610 family)
MRTIFIYKDDDVKDQIWAESEHLEVQRAKYLIGIVEGEYCNAEIILSMSSYNKCPQVGEVGMTRTGNCMKVTRVILSTPIKVITNPHFQFVNSIFNGNNDTLKRLKDVLNTHPSNDVYDVLNGVRSNETIKIELPKSFVRNGIVFELLEVDLLKEDGKQVAYAPKTDMKLTQRVKYGEILSTSIREWKIKCK